jgi:DNA invertase Pin-like site-specific DNA recombinase
MKTAILYLRAPADLKDLQSVLVSQATALGSYCQENSIDVLHVYYDTTSNNATHRPERDKLIKEVFDRRLKPDFLLFTTLEVFGDDLLDVLNLNHILAKYGVTIKAIQQPNLVFATTHITN